MDLLQVLLNPDNRIIAYYSKNNKFSRGYTVHFSKINKRPNPLAIYMHIHTLKRHFICVLAKWGQTLMEQSVMF